LSTEPALREIGRIGRPHGVRGDVHVSLITDRTERLAPGAQVRAAGRWLTVQSARPQAKHWLVHFTGVDDRTAAEQLTSAVLLAEPLPARDDGLWVHDLIGSRVVETDGTDRGTCTAVLANPAHDILELDEGSLVPVTFVTSFADGVITIDPPEGLFDLE